MKEALNKLHQYFIPDKYRTGEQSYRKAKILVNTSFITSVFAISFTLLAILLLGQYMVGYALILWSAVFFSIPWLLKAGVGRSVCANLFVVVTFTSTVWDIYWHKGVESPEYWWLAMTPLVAIFLDGIKSGVFWLIPAVLAAIGVGIANMLGYYMPSDIKLEHLDIAYWTSNLGLVLLMTLIALIMEQAYVRSLTRLRQKNEIIAKEKKRSEELLLNILPSEVMEELKATGHTKARNYDLVTVLFADIVDFTSIVESLPPEDLVSGIDEYFEAFDHILEKYDVEKIKTIGDAYVCASGLPKANSNNPVVVVELGLELAATVEELKEKRRNLGQIAFDVRFGVHSGPVVAGVVGVKKFAYDIWGDTVNTAARMQEEGAPGKINISRTTHDLVKHRFECTYRGPIDAKHKGQVFMYFVEGKKTHAPT